MWQSSIFNTGGKFRPDWASIGVTSCYSSRLFLCTLDDMIIQLELILETRNAFHCAPLQQLPGVSLYEPLTQGCGLVQTLERIEEMWDLSIWAWEWPAKPGN